MTWHNLCKLNELPSDAGKEFLIDGTILAVFRREDVVHAIDGICAHQGGPIAEGELKADCITCPWHGWQYDIKSGTNLLTGKQMLSSFTTEIRGEDVWVEITLQE